MRIEEASSARQIAEILEREKRQKLQQKQSRENELKLSAKENAEAMSKILNDLPRRFKKKIRLNSKLLFEETEDFRSLFVS